MFVCSQIYLFVRLFIWQFVCQSMLIVGCCFFAVGLDRLWAKNGVIVFRVVFGEKSLGICRAPGPNPGGPVTNACFARSARPANKTHISPACVLLSTRLLPETLS